MLGLDACQVSALLRGQAAAARLGIGPCRRPAEGPKALIPPCSQHASGRFSLSDDSLMHSRSILMLTCVDGGRPAFTAVRGAQNECPPLHPQPRYVHRLGQCHQARALEDLHIVARTGGLQEQSDKQGGQGSATAGSEGGLGDGGRKPYPTSLPGGRDLTLT